MKPILPRRAAPRRRQRETESGAEIARKIRDDADRARAEGDARGAAALRDMADFVDRLREIGARYRVRQ